MQTLFLGPTYPSRSRNIASDRCINFYPEINQSDSKGEPGNSGIISLIGTPGAALAFNVAATTIRGMHVFNNYLWFVAGDILYQMDTNGIVTAISGTMATSTGRVIIIDNGIKPTLAGVLGHWNQLFIVDGTSTGYIYDVVAGGALTTTTGGVYATFLDGYFVVCGPSSAVAQSSAYFDGTSFPVLANAVVAGSSDNLQAVVSISDQLWMIKEFNSQLWNANGQTTSLGFPFSLVPGASADYGTPAPYSVARGDQAIFFLANAREGDGGKFAGVVMIQGNSPQIISTPAINYQISQYTTISDAFGYCRVHEGHSFYVLTFPSANGSTGATWVYDRTTGFWHEWSSYVQPYQVARHISNCYSFFSGQEYVGDYNSGNVYTLSSKVYTDNSLPIVSTRICQHQYDRQDNANIFIYRLHVDMETGVGDSEVLTQTGIDPQATLSWSNDGGHSFGNDYLASVGAVGLYKKRLIWRRLGYARDRVFNLTISDPVKKAVVGVFVN